MKRLGRRIHGHERAVAALGVTAAAAVALVVGSMLEERRSKQTTDGSSAAGRSLPAVSEPPVTGFVPPVSRRRLRGRDSVLDLVTGAWSPLPRSILRSQAINQGSAVRGVAEWIPACLCRRRGRGEHPDLRRAHRRLRRAPGHPRSEGRRVARLVAGRHQIAYEGYGSRHRHLVGLFVLDVGTGESRRVVDESRSSFGATPQFTPDGSSLYTGGSSVLLCFGRCRLPGRSRLLIGPGEGLNDAGNGSLSPDGSRLTFLASGTPQSGPVEHCGPCRWLAYADGTNKRVVRGCLSQIRQAPGRPTVAGSRA